MYNLIQESTATLVDTWESMIEDRGGIADIKVDQVGDVISRAWFGINFSRNGEVFSTLRALEEVTSKAILAAKIPGMGLLPTKTNRECWALEKELRMLILKVVKQRNEFGYENDLLQTLLKGAKNVVITREAFKDIKFGGITVPKGVNIWTLVTRLHTDPELWGPNAYKFNPKRFANGVTGACKQPHLYMPFGVMHKPSLNLVIEPGNGVDLLVKKL
ncbi:hypothetical protein RJ640_000751 [Escallonia rubra]|uniref:Cytochrome P450 n=1 Tax=Escallonia rubra TaxID=112253 RepID=A0AA88U5P7_9ASTE|nr:hypothetical protein RJ640_000751 [Escallonia rubra]